MMNASNMLTTLTTAGLVLVGATAANAGPTEVAYQDEVQSCIAQVGQHANYDEATRVRHTVVLLEETRLRYKFSIGTSVFTDSNDEAARNYTAYCVVLGNGKPLQFRIDADTA